MIVSPREWESTEERAMLVSPRRSPGRLMVTSRRNGADVWGGCIFGGEGFGVR